MHVYMHVNMHVYVCVSVCVLSNLSLAQVYLCDGQGGANHITITMTQYLTMTSGSNGSDSRLCLVCRLDAGCNTTGGGATRMLCIHGGSWYDRCLTRELKCFKQLATSIIRLLLGSSDVKIHSM